MRPAKRPRLNSSYPDENLVPFYDPLTPLYAGASHRKPSNKDEKSLMDDLLAGLDASVFESFDASPVKSILSERMPRSPLKVKRENAPPIRDRTSNITREHGVSCKDIEPDVNRQSQQPALDVEHEAVSIARSRIPTTEIKLDLEDEDIYDFEFDLSNISALSDDILLKPEAIEVSWCVKKTLS